MGRTLLGRLSRLFLVVAFVGSGFGLPEVDALLYHSSGHAPPADVAHVDLPGGCGAHAEHCVLALTTSLRQLGVTTTAGLRVLRVETVYPVPALMPALLSADRTNLQPSRAPPVAVS